MLDLRLTYQGGGRFQTATRFDLELAERTFEHGEEVAAKVTHKRSFRQNNTFHAMCEYAHDNQRAGPVLASWRALKQWLLVRADHCHEKRVHVGNLTLREVKVVGMALALALRAKDDYVGVAYDRKTGEFVERTAKSVKFTATLSDEMSGLFDKIVHIICTEIIPGTDPVELVEMVKSSLKGSQMGEAA